MEIGRFKPLLIGAIQIKYDEANVRTPGQLLWGLSLCFRARLIACPRAMSLLSKRSF